MNIDIITIAHLFSHHTILSVSPFGNGNINDTFLVTDKNKPFILQRINATVFAEPELIFANQLRLQRLLKEENTGHGALRIPQLILSKSGQSAHLDQQGNYWRAQEFVVNSKEIEQLGAQQAESVGVLLGQFHNLCPNEEIEQFHDTLPGLHQTSGHLDIFTAIKQSHTDTAQPDLTFCFDCIKRHQEEAREIDHAIHNHTTPTRLIHGDPKLANILFDLSTNQACSLIDLDTIGPGFIHHDLSDLIRSCCNLSGEDSSAEPSFDLSKAKNIITGYSHTMASLLTQEESRFLGTGLWIIPFELGVRFINDYLTGSRYFKITSPHHNLIRARNQFSLAMQILQNKDDLQDHVNDCCKDIKLPE